MHRYLIAYRTASGTKESRVSPHLANKAQAFYWLYLQKPEIIDQLGELVIKEWDRNDRV